MYDSHLWDIVTYVLWDIGPIVDTGTDCGTREPIVGLGADCWTREPLWDNL